MFREINSHQPRKCYTNVVCVVGRTIGHLSLCLALALAPREALGDGKGHHCPLS